jgi:hypothetical protein
MLGYMSESLGKLLMLPALVGVERTRYVYRWCFGGSGDLAE